MGHQMSASGHKSSSGGSGGSIVLLLFIGLIWLLAETWPWCLLAIPSILLILLICSNRFRQRFTRSFDKKASYPEIVGFRRRLAWTFLISGCVSAIACSIGVDSSDLRWWLVPVALVALVLRLFELSPAKGRRSRVRGALCTNLRELFNIAAVVLSLYAIALLWLSRLPLETTTLEELQRWEEYVQKAHEFSEKYKPSLLLLVGFLIIAITLRIGAKSMSTGEILLKLVCPVICTSEIVSVARKVS
jgi:hypothetical protein